MNRAQLVIMVRLLIGIGILLLMLAFLRACFSPPMLPTHLLQERSMTATIGSLLPENSHRLLQTCGACRGREHHQQMIDTPIVRKRIIMPDNQLIDLNRNLLHFAFSAGQQQMSDGIRWCACRTISQTHNAGDQRGHQRRRQRRTQGSNREVSRNRRRDMNIFDGTKRPRVITPAISWRQHASLNNDALETHATMRNRVEQAGFATGTVHDTGQRRRQHHQHGLHTSIGRNTMARNHQQRIGRSATGNPGFFTVQTPAARRQRRQCRRQVFRSLTPAFTQQQRGKSRRGQGRQQAAQCRLVATGKTKCELIGVDAGKNGRDKRIVLDAKIRAPRCQGLRCRMGMRRRITQPRNQLISVHNGLIGEWILLSGKARRRVRQRHGEESQRRMATKDAANPVISGSTRQQHLQPPAQ